MARRLSVHGVRVDVGLFTQNDAFGRFFDFFPPRPPHADSPADLVITVRESEEEVDISNYAPKFFHGKVQAYEGPTDLLVTDGKARAYVSRDGRTLEMFLPPKGAFLTEGVAHVALVYALRIHRFVELHSAAVTMPSDAPIMVVGDSGAGKTTLLLAFVAAGFSWLADDRVLLRRESGDVLPRVYAYPRVFHVGPKTIAAFPELAPNARTAFAGDKRNVEPADMYSENFDAGGRAPSLLLFPRIAGGPRTRRSPIAQSEAFGQLLVSSAILAVEGMPMRDENLACLRDLVAHVPSFEVLLGDDLLSDPTGVVRALLPMRNDS